MTGPDKWVCPRCGQYDNTDADEYCYFCKWHRGDPVPLYAPPPQPPANPPPAGRVTQDIYLDFFG